MDAANPLTMEEGGRRTHGIVEEEEEEHEAGTNQPSLFGSALLCRYKEVLASPSSSSESFTLEALYEEIRGCVEINTEAFPQESSVTEGYQAWVSQSRGSSAVSVAVVLGLFRVYSNACHAIVQLLQHHNEELVRRREEAARTAHAMDRDADGYYYRRYLAKYLDETVTGEELDDDSHRTASISGLNAFFTTICQVRMACAVLYYAAFLLMAITVIGQRTKVINASDFDVRLSLALSLGVEYAHGVCVCVWAERVSVHAWDRDVSVLPIGVSRGVCGHRVRRAPPLRVATAALHLLPATHRQRHTNQISPR